MIEEEGSKEEPPSVMVTNPVMVTDQKTARLAAPKFLSQASKDSSSSVGGGGGARWAKLRQHVSEQRKDRKQDLLDVIRAKYAMEGIGAPSDGSASEGRAIVRINEPDTTDAEHPPGSCASCRHRCFWPLRCLTLMVFLPEGRFRRNWDLLVCIAVIYVALFLPLEVSFWANNLNGSNRAFEWELIKGVGWLITAIFLADIWVESKTAFIDPITGELNFSRKAIMIRYAFKRVLGLWFDLLTSFPIAETFEGIYRLTQTDTSVGLDHRGQTVIRLINALKILRLVRIVRLLRYMDRNLNVNAGVLTAIKVILTLFLVIHWIG